MNSLTTVIHKQPEHDEISRLIQEFQSKGGVIEVLGNTPVRDDIVFQPSGYSQEKGE